MLVKSEDEGGIISRVIKDLFRDTEADRAAASSQSQAPVSGRGRSPPPPAETGTTTSSSSNRAASVAATATANGETIEFTVSFVEIYMEQIRDLLAPSGNGTPAATAAAAGGLKIRENAQRGIFIEDMTQVTTASEHATMELVKAGILNRAVSSTRMNKDSSRSHSILIITCTRKSLKHTVIKRSSMYIVDLAGSEFVNKTNAAGKVLQEAKAINKSLSALSNVIKALVEGKKHVPYRDSKLTRILQDSLGGSAKTCLILAASCSSYNMPETISTLRFGLRAKEIKNPVVQRQESAPSIGPGGIFKELYQQAMAELEEKNKKIDELQRLLSAVYDETAQQQEELEPSGDDNVSLEQQEPVWLEGDADACCAPSDGAKPTSQDEGGLAADSCKGCDEKDDSTNKDDDSDRGEDDESTKTLALALQEKDELAQRMTTLADENKRLFHVLEALESQLDQVGVDFSESGQPLLRLRMSLSAASELQLQSSADAVESLTPPEHLPSLKMWLQSDKWQQALERELIEPRDDGQATASAASPPRGVSVHPLSVESDALAARASPLKHELLLHSSTPSDSSTSATDDASGPRAPSLSSLLPCADNTDTTPCVHRIDAEALSRQIVELKLQLHYVSESTKLALDGETHVVVLENAKLKTRVDELEFHASLATVACNQLEMKHRACETRLSNQETHIGCLQNSLQEYQGLFKQQIIMSQEKCRLLTDELEFYKKLAKCSQPSSMCPGLASPPKSSPSPRKHRGSSGSTGFAAAAVASPALSKPNPVSTMLFPELEHELHASSGSNTSSPSSNPFGLWRTFGSLYKPSAGKTAPSTEVEIELAEKSSATLSAASVSPLSVKMSRPIIKPIGSAPAPAALASAAPPEGRDGADGSSYSPWIVKGFDSGINSASVTNMRTPLMQSRPDATLDELAAPIEMSE